MAKYEAEKVDKLAQEIMRHKDLYYAGTPEISDYDYDLLEDALRCLAPYHPVLSFIGSDASIIGKKVIHDEPMLSLQKCYDKQELYGWADDRELTGTWKVDGNSLSLVFINGKLEVAKTRGNGRFGEDVTDKARWVSSIVPELTSAVSVEVRGELYCSLSRFAELAGIMVARGLDSPTSPRNIVAGILGRKNHADLARHFHFLAFDVLIKDGSIEFQKESDKFEWLQRAGFAMPGLQVLKGISAIDNYLAMVNQMMGEADFALDGAVFTLNDLKLHRELGFTSHHPRFKMSFKWQGETAISQIQRISWSTSRHGIVTPVAVISPVVLSGAQISNVTLHNSLNVKTHKLKVGDQIEIVRSGEVIPKFLRVVQQMGGSYEEPDSCPSCDAPLIFDGVRLKCPNQAGCPAQILRGILNWLRSAQIDDLSEKRLEKMIEMGLVESVPDLYRLQPADLLMLPATKEKMAQKLYVNIQASLNLPLAHFLTGLGIGGAGLASWEKLLLAFPGLDKIRAVSKEEIEKIAGFAVKSAEQIVQGLKDKAQLIDELLLLGIDPAAPILDEAKKTASPIAGKQIAITGKLSRPREEIEELIKDLGGKPSTSISKNTAALISNEPDSNSSKMKKARQLEIPVWSEEHFFALTEDKGI